MVEQVRVNLPKAVPSAYRALNQLDQVVRSHAAEAGLDALLVELVKIRASQLNGCASCLETHAAVAAEHSETPERLALIPAWRHASCFAPRERAALLLTEEITLVAKTGVSDEIYEQVSRVLTEAEIAAVSWIVVVINAYNRIAVTGRHPAGVPH